MFEMLSTCGNICFGQKNIAYVHAEKCILKEVVETGEIFHTMS